MTNKHRGFFKVSHELIERHPDAVLLVMAKCIIIRAESHFDGFITYDALSDLFRELKEGERAPLYEWTCTEGALGEPASVSCHEVGYD